VGELLDRVELIVAVRPPWQDRIDTILDTLAETLGAEQVERIRSGVVNTPLIDLSSTEIRRRVSEDRSIRFMVPESVRGYIDRHGLYLNTS
jgi:nicotinate-nucleotide adenylyltransferase